MSSSTGISHKAGGITSYFQRDIDSIEAYLFLVIMINNSNFRKKGVRIYPERQYYLVCTEFDVRMHTDIFECDALT